jgi:multiple antibiotic resistance protein
METLLQVFFAIFGVMDPVGNVPVFLTLTGKMDPATRQLMARKAVIRAGIILVLFAFLGNAILNVFHVSIESFRIAGGIVLVILGLQIVIRSPPRSSPVPA